MKKRILSIILAIAMLACMIPLGTMTAFAEPADLSSYGLEGDGTADSPYQIGTKAQLENLAEIVNGGTDCADTYFELTGNIGSTNDPVTTTIGSAANIFNGHFNGNGHTVTVNLTVASDYCALFAVLGNGGEIINLTTAGSVLGGKNNYIGVVCGYNYGTIDNCCNTATVNCNTATANSKLGVGGVCGYNNGTITNCYNNGTVSSSNGVGGVCGYNKGTITNCYNTSAVSGYTYIGGVCGFNTNGGTITNCYNTGAVSGDKYVDGVCYNKSIITNCYCSDAAYSGDAVGDGTGTTTDCFKLSAAQMQAAAGSTLSTGVANNKPLVDLLNEYVNNNPSAGLKSWVNKQGEYPVFGTPHTHTAGTEYMTNGVAHWLKCGGDDCDLETVEDYKAAFKKDETLKTTLGYKETAAVGGLMGRQGLRNKEAGTVSESVGRTIFGLTQDQLGSIGNNLVIIGSDGEKQVNITVDCAYTWFYDGGEKVEAGKDGLEAYAAFVIIDNDGTTNDDNTINGYGYYRLYSDSTDNFLFDAQFRDPVLYLDSITVQPPTKLEYSLNENLNTTGMTVTAHYKKGEEDKDVTNSVTCTPDKFEELGAATVTVSYTENDVTRTDTFDVTVTEKTVSFKNVDGYNYYPIFDYVPEGVHFFTEQGAERTAMSDDIAYAKVSPDSEVIHTVRYVEASWGDVFDIIESDDCCYPYDANVSDDFKSKMLLSGSGESVATFTGDPMIRDFRPTVNDFDIYAINNMIFGQSNGASFWSNTIYNASTAVCFDCGFSVWKQSSINQSLNVLICRDF